MLYCLELEKNVMCTTLENKFSVFFFLIMLATATNDLSPDLHRYWESSFEVHWLFKQMSCGERILGEYYCTEAFSTPSIFFLFKNVFISLFYDAAHKL